MRGEYVVFPHVMRVRLTAYPENTNCRRKGGKRRFMILERLFAETGCFTTNAGCGMVYTSPEGDSERCSLEMTP